MRKIKIADGIHMLTMNVDEILFEGMWDIMKGVTHNSNIAVSYKHLTMPTKAKE